MVIAMNRILLIYQQQTERERLSSILSRAGFQVISAQDSRAGLVKLRQTPPDVVVMADESPEIQRMCSDIREMPYIPILVLGKGDEDVRALMLDLGADMYVDMAIAPEELITRVHVLLRRREKPEVREPYLESEEKQVEPGGRTIPEILSKVIRSSLDQIVEGWIAELRKKPGTDIHRRLGTRKLVANIHALLYALASALTPEKPSCVGAEREFLREASHLAELRQAQGFRIGDLIEEHVLLRGQIWQLLVEKLADADIDMLESWLCVHRVLDNALRVSVETFHDIEREDLLERSSIDGLTGLYNHAHLWERLEQEVARAKRYNQPIAMLMIDIDNFKAYNDLYGHPHGDLVLTEMAGILQNQRRSSDIAARYGGEEFTLILPQTGAAGAQAAAERIRKAIAAHRFALVAERQHTVTVSIGCAASEEGYISPQDLVDVADHAMYEAKREGKNRTCTYLCRSGQRNRLS